jgi:hypothetical protein
VGARHLSGIVERAGVFVQIHSDTAFGWHTAKTFAGIRQPFPMTVIGRDHWLFKAYLMHFNPTGYFDPSVLEAYHLSQLPGISAKLKSLLMTGLGKPINAHLDLVAEKTGIPRRTVEAFEILFYNILDRHKDGLYLSSLVYPDCRVVVFAEDYFKTTPIPDLLLRAAHAYRDIELISRLAGLDGASFVKELVALRDGDAEAKLEKWIMGNALAMAQLGMLNQRGVGIQRATSLLAAGRPRANKANEAATQNPHDTSGELAAAIAAIPPITDAERKEMHAAVRPGRHYWHDEDGNIMPFDEYDDPPDASQSVDGSSVPLVMFPDPVTAVWSNQDFDKPVIIVGRMSEPGLPDHYLTIEGSGVPATEVFFVN